MSCQTKAIHISENNCLLTDYRIIKSVTVMRTVLITTDSEFTALERPMSDFRVPVKAGAAEAIGLSAKIVRACRYSSGRGRRK